MSASTAQGSRRTYVSHRSIRRILMISNLRIYHGRKTKLRFLRGAFWKWSYGSLRGLEAKAIVWHLFGTDHLRNTLSQREMNREEQTFDLVALIYLLVNCPRKWAAEIFIIFEPTHIPSRRMYVQQHSNDRSTNDCVLSITFLILPSRLCTMLNVCATAVPTSSWVNRSSRLSTLFILSSPKIFLAYAPAARWAT